METKGTAFMKGGCGCLGLLGIICLMAILARGRVRVDFFGLLFIFVIGGIIGLTFFSAYDKGRKDAMSRTEPPPPSGEDHPPSTDAPPVRDYVHEPTSCVQCGMTIPPGATVCSRCGWTYKENNGS